MPERLIRKAKLADIGKVHRMVNYYADTKGNLLPRSIAELSEHIRDFVVAEEDEQLLGCCALHIVWDDLGEVRSLVVEESAQGRHIGEALLLSAIKEAQDLGLPKLFVLTYIPDFFCKYGFEVVNKSKLPHKIWSECIRCPKFPDCDEVALILDLSRT